MHFIKAWMRKASLSRAEHKNGIEVVRYYALLPSHFQTEIEELWFSKDKRVKVFLNGRQIFDHSRRIKFYENG